MFILKHYGTRLALIWAFSSAVIFWIAATATKGSPLIDPDDFLRMVQVRDWIAGQSWFDVTQYRMHPPEGGAMHWSRWLDVPIAGMSLLTGMFLTHGQSDVVTVTLLPLMLLGLLMWVTFKMVSALADQNVALLAAFILPTYPMIIHQFQPGRVDHHSWQIIMAGWATMALLGKNQLKSAVIIGCALAFWMHISIEGLPYAVVFGGILVLLYLFPQLSPFEEPDNRLIPFLNIITLASIALFMSTQQASNWLVAQCDAVSWPLLAALTAVSVGMTLIQYLVGNRSVWIKLALMVVLGAIATWIFLANTGSCAIDPFGHLPPLVRQYWYETVKEGLPITAQFPAVVLLLLIVPLLFLIWMVLLLRSDSDKTTKKRWLLLSFLVLCATAISWKVQRTAGVAELLALLGIAALTEAAIFKIRLQRSMPMRVIGIAAAIIILSPVTIVVAINSLFFASAEQRQAHSPTSKKLRGCSFAELNALQPGLIFTNMAAGPEILYRTRHSIFVSGYHRNYKAMDQLIKTMLAPTPQAYRTLRDAKVRYVVLCPAYSQMEPYLTANKKGFAADLMSDRHPAWLQPVPTFADSEMRVFRFQATD